MTVDQRPEVVLMCGVAGAGKTTYAKRFEADGYVRLSVDEEVWATHGRYGIDYPAEQYAAHSAAAGVRLRHRLVELLAAGERVVVDLSFWSRASRDEVKSLVEAHGGRWRLIHLKVPADELRRRLAERSHRFDANAAFTVDEQLLAAYLAGFEEPHGEGEEVVRQGPPRPTAD